MKLNFPKSIISIRSSADKWGPFTFDCSEAIPSGTSIADVAVSSYLVDMDEGEISTESTDELVESGASASGTDVTLRLQYPGADLAGYHALLLDLTLDDGDSAQNGLLFGFILVESP